jgi:hypothetical protein
MSTFDKTQLPDYMGEELPPEEPLEPTKPPKVKEPQPALNGRARLTLNGVK